MVSTFGRYNVAAKDCRRAYAFAAATKVGGHLYKLKTQLTHSA
jgi:hypothetical protein